MRVKIAIIKPNTDLRVAFSTINDIIATIQTQNIIWLQGAGWHLELDPKTVYSLEVLN